MTKKNGLLILLTCITMSLSAMDSDSDSSPPAAHDQELSKEKEKIKRELKNNFLKMLAELAAQYDSRKACDVCVLDGVTALLNSAAQQEIFFNDREINPIMLDPIEASFSPLLVAAVHGHPKLVEAFGKHPIERLTIETRYDRKTPENIATREATRFFGVSSGHVKTLIALRQLREQKLEERLHKKEKE